MKTRMEILKKSAEESENRSRDSQVGMVGRRFKSRDLATFEL
jgi:hypothetical protein